MAMSTFLSAMSMDKVTSGKNGSKAITFIPFPRAYFAVNCPILPKPITPRVLPLNSLPLAYFFLSTLKEVFPSVGIFLLESYTNLEMLNK